jgi:ketosteroid isomerase-like protein
MNERKTTIHPLKRPTVAVAAVVVSASLAAGQGRPTAATAAEVRQTETAFAKTMADRNHAAFTSFLSEEAVFMGRTILRGKAQVAQAWKGFYEGAQAPFSWAPERVEVLDSGNLGFSTGPVYDSSGKRSGTFNSVWRREADGRWRIVFDSGCPPCDCPPASSATPSPAPAPSRSPAP